MRNHLPVTSLVFVLLFVGCYSSSKIGKQNIAGLYLPKSNVESKIIDYRFIDEGKSIILFLQLNPFNVKRNNSNFDAKLSIKLYNNTITTNPIREIVQPVEINNLKAKFTFDAIGTYDLVVYTLESENLTETITGFLPVTEFGTNNLTIQKNKTVLKRLTLLKMKI